ncbi:hypothetical protein CAEBREN_17305 [Caenorhabditis brenneri]|uniref:Uncharacterized protein n=1 Tax=Caenorhabditis brenneri TaxID=135651 RepID=G0NW86_CAEBE|nr:hypothetical protein CAEBREN_17305 [Caenorhabditis brenneri]
MPLPPLNESARVSLFTKKQKSGKITRISATPFTEEWRRQLNGGEADGSLLSSGPSEPACFGSMNQRTSRSQQPRRSSSRRRSPDSPAQSRSPTPFTPEAIEKAVRSTARRVPLWRKRRPTGSRFLRKKTQPWRQNGGIRLGGSGHRERGLYHPPPQRGERAAVTSSGERESRSSTRPQSGLRGRGHSSIHPDHPLRQDVKPESPEEIPVRNDDEVPTASHAPPVVNPPPAPPGPMI